MAWNMSFYTSFYGCFLDLVEHEYEDSKIYAFPLGGTMIEQPFAIGGI